jgi:signal transduction histidine kinase
VAKDSQSPSGITGGPSALRPAEFELHCLRQLVAFAAQFHESTDGDKLARAALRAGMELLGAGEGCLAILSPGQRQVEVPFSVPREASWDRELFTSFIRGGENRIPGEIALGRLRRRGRMWGVLAVRSPGGRFRWDHREALSSLAAIASGVLDRSDREQLRKVRARIDCKILEQIRPKDLFYQVLHGLHSLTRYDHSASLLMYDAASGSMEVVAEVITWKKAKSDRVGSKISFPDEFLPLLRAGVVYGFDRSAGEWQEWTGHDAVGLVSLTTATDAARAAAAAPPDASRLIAPLATREHVLGLLTVAATYPGSFGPYEAELVGQFLPHASVAIQNSRRTESLELNLIQAERKHAMADLARGVAHDVNNALGAVLPLVQQMRADLSAGRLDAESLTEDLSQIEGSIQVSRRIFGGMLRFARGAAPEVGANVRQAVDNTLAILKEGLSRRGIRAAVTVDAGLPALPGPQGDLEQLLLNLLTNARDAMPTGGQLTISAGRAGSSIEVAVEDTGAGIAQEHLSKIMEPFFSTKPGGNGLGLSICRSIVWQLQGKLDIRSVPGQGTRVTAIIPLSPAGGS